MYQHYSELLDQGIEMDLIYAPVMLQAWKEHQASYQDYTCLYVHSGGVKGNISQLERYEKIIKGV